MSTSVTNNDFTPRNAIKDNANFNQLNEQDLKQRKLADPSKVLPELLMITLIKP